MGLAGRLSTWPRRLGLILLLVAAIRVPFLWMPPSSDEAGFYQVARAWHFGGPYLYGRYWVDRPPGLISVFAVAGLFGHLWVVRVLAIAFAIAFVVFAAVAGRLAGGSRTWAAAAAAALVVTPAIQAPLATGELLAIPFVMGSVAATLAAVRRRGRSAFALAALSGAAAALAMSMKQNFAGGFAFAIILLVALVLRREIRKRDAATVLAGGFAGAGLVGLAMVAVGMSSPAGLPGLWFAVVEFRVLADSVVATHSTVAPMLRAGRLVQVAVVSGMVPIVIVLLVRAWRARLRGQAVSWAIGITLVFDVLGVLGGGSYWLHYLIQPAPMLALAIGRWAPRSAWLRRVAVLTVVSALTFSVSTAALAATREIDGADDTGTWVSQAARPGDTAVTLFGHAEVQLATGLPSPYPYLWSLPMRTLDPKLHRLVRLLGSDHGPTWVIAWSDLNPWGIDRQGTLTRAISQHYRLVGTVCSHRVWLRDGVRRSLAPMPRCAHSVSPTRF